MPVPSEIVDVDQRGLGTVLLGDGRGLISLTGICLAMAGGFVIFQSATGHFLPHDVDYLGMTAAELCGYDECRIVHFMFHDRVSFGGVLVAVGALYLWLAEFPMRQRLPWAWWTLAGSGATGFASFLTYLGYGYLDSWHGVATLFLLPCFIAGLVSCWFTLPSHALRAVWQTRQRIDLSSRLGRGRLCLVVAAMGITGAGLVISMVGMTIVFVPQDLAFMQVTVEYLHHLNPRLVPLIAHDRAGFGGGLISGGVALIGVLAWAPTSRHLWQIAAMVGSVGFSTAIAIHFVIGYDDALHLAPAVAGAALYLLGLAWTRQPMLQCAILSDRENNSPTLR